MEARRRMEELGIMAIAGGSDEASYRFHLLTWDGIPATMGEVPSPHEAYEWLDRAFDSLLIARYDGHYDREEMRRVIKAIKADHRGIKPRFEVAPVTGDSTEIYP